MLGRSIVLWLTCCMALATARAAEPAGAVDWLKLAVARLCAGGPMDGLAAQNELPGVWLLDDVAQERSGRVFRIKQRFLLPGGDELRIERFEPGGRLRRFTAEYHAKAGAGHSPELQAAADGSCTLRSGRRIVQGSDGITRKLRATRWRPADGALDGNASGAVA